MTVQDAAQHTNIGGFRGSSYRHLEVAAGEAQPLPDHQRSRPRAQGQHLGALHQVSLAGSSGQPNPPCKQAVTGKHTARLHGGRAAAAAAHHTRTHLGAGSHNLTAAHAHAVLPNSCCHPLPLPSLTSAPPPLPALSCTPPHPLPLPTPGHLPSLLLPACPPGPAAAAASTAAAQQHSLPACGSQRAAHLSPFPTTLPRAAPSLGEAVQDIGRALIISPADNECKGSTLPGEDNYCSPPPAGLPGWATYPWQPP
ncbi:hypothetical protein V8C86DRAFT_69389 [Haematococcus lacustris]